MNYEIVKLVDFSGDRASVYSVIIEGQANTKFEQFIHNHDAEYRTEVDEIVSGLGILDLEQEQDYNSLSLMKGAQEIRFALYMIREEN